jgi:hypothetical protein
MIMLAMILAGVLIAAALDWAIYTHLSAYLRAGFRLDRHLQFFDLLSTKWQKGRFALIIASGIVAGLAFSVSDSTLWLGALAVFLLGHALIYLYVFER